MESAFTIIFYPEVYMPNVESPLHRFPGDLLRIEA